MSKAFPVNGVAELDKALSFLPMKLQRGAYRSGLVAAAAVIRDEARQRAPKQSGKMAKSIKTGNPRQNPDGSFSVSIRPDGEHGFLALFHEYGVAPHFIAAGDAGMSPRLLTRAGRDGIDIAARKGSDGEPEVLVINGNFITGAVQHPGLAPRPFMRPALDAKADEAVKAFADRIRAAIEGVLNPSNPNSKLNREFNALLDEAA